MFNKVSKPHFTMFKHNKFSIELKKKKINKNQEHNYYRFGVIQKKPTRAYLIPLTQKKRK